MIKRKLIEKLNIDYSPLDGVSYVCVECEYGVRAGDPHFEEMICEECCRKKKEGASNA